LIHSFGSIAPLARTATVLLLAASALPFAPCDAASLTYKTRVVGDASQAPLAPFVFAEYSNGLRAIVRETRGTPVATVDIWVYTGAANEEPPVGGISHFFEHMFFKGTERYGLGEMDKVIKRLGGRNNASTSLETTHYFATVPSESVATAIDVVTDGILHSIFDPAEVDRERLVIKEEIRRKEDTPASKVWVLFQRVLAPELPYSRPVLGTFESLDRVDHDAFVAYLRFHYVPRNMVVVVAGDVAVQPVLDRIAERFADVPDLPPPAQPEFELPPVEEARVIDEVKDTRQSYFMAGYPTRGRRGLEDLAVLDVASAIFAGGQSSRLHRALVEEQGLLTSVSASHYPLRNGGAFTVYGEGPPENSPAARAAVVEEFERLATSLPSKEELARARSFAASEWTLGNETTSAITGTLGRNELFYGAERALRYETEIAAVTPADVQRVLRRIVKPGRYLMAVIEPSQPKEAP